MSKNLQQQKSFFKVIRHPDSALSLLLLNMEERNIREFFCFHSNFDFQLCAMLVDFEYRDLTYAHRATVDSAENS